LIYQYNFLAY